MAIIEKGALISSIRGSVGGVTFCSSRSGTIAKLKMTGRIAGTEKQYIKRQTFPSLNNSYRVLTVLQKVSWDDFSLLYTKTNMFGNTRKLSGPNWYVSINYWRQLASQSVLDTPNPHTLPQSVPAYTVTNTFGTIVLKLPVYTPLANERILIYMTKPTNKGDTSSNSLYRFGEIDTTASEDEYNLDAMFLDINGFSYSSVESNGEFNIGIGVRFLDMLSGIAGSIDRTILRVG